MSSPNHNSLVIPKAPEPVTEPTSPRLLHLGCGLCAPTEWVNVDGSTNAWLAQRPLLKWLVGTLRLVPRSQLEIPWPTNITIANLKRPLPFPDASFDAVYSSHTFEHLYRTEALALLQEVVRVLKPGGICRTLVPDLGSFIKEYRGEMIVEDAHNHVQDDPARRLCQRMLIRYETAPRRGGLYTLAAASTDLHHHKWMYDGPSLVKLMAEGGLTNCQERGFLESDIPHLDKVEAPGRVLQGIGVVVEGTRPHANA